MRQYGDRAAELSGCATVARQAKGFKRLRVIPEVLEAEDPAFAHRIDNGELEVGLDTMAYAAPDRPDENSVSNVDEVGDHFQYVVVPKLARLAKLAQDSLLPDVRAWLRPSFGVSQDDVRVEQITKRIRVLRVPSFQAGPCNIDVLS
jgi:hypothetical protein